MLWKEFKENAWKGLKRCNKYVYDLENVRYLPDRAKERGQRNAKTDFIVASDVSWELKVELLLCCYELVSKQLVGMFVSRHDTDSGSFQDERGYSGDSCQL